MVPDISNTWDNPQRGKSIEKKYMRKDKYGLNQFRKVFGRSADQIMQYIVTR